MRKARSARNLRVPLALMHARSTKTLTDEIKTELGMGDADAAVDVTRGNLLDGLDRAFTAVSSLASSFHDAISNAARSVVADDGTKAVAPAAGSPAAAATAAPSRSEKSGSGGHQASHSGPNDEPDPLSSLLGQGVLVRVTVLNASACLLHRPPYTPAHVRERVELGRVCLGGLTAAASTVATGLRRAGRRHTASVSLRSLTVFDGPIGHDDPEESGADCRALLPRVVSSAPQLGAAQPSALATPQSVHIVPEPFPTGGAAGGAEGRGSPLSFAGRLMRSIFASGVPTQPPNANHAAAAAAEAREAAQQQRQHRADAEAFADDVFGVEYTLPPPHLLRLAATVSVSPRPEDHPDSPPCFADLVVHGHLLPLEVVWRDALLSEAHRWAARVRAQVVPLFPSAATAAHGADDLAAAAAAAGAPSSTVAPDPTAVSGSGADVDDGAASLGRASLDFGGGVLPKRREVRQRVPWRSPAAPGSATAGDSAGASDSTTAANTVPAPPATAASEANAGTEPAAATTSAWNTWWGLSMVESIGVRVGFNAHLPLLIVPLPVPHRNPLTPLAFPSAPLGRRPLPPRERALVIDLGHFSLYHGADPDAKDSARAGGGLGVKCHVHGAWQHMHGEVLSLPPRGGARGLLGGHLRGAIGLGMRFRSPFTAPSAATTTISRDAAPSNGAAPRRRRRRRPPRRWRRSSWTSWCGSDDARRADACHLVVAPYEGEEGTHAARRLVVYRRRK